MVDEEKLANEPTFYVSVPPVALAVATSQWLVSISLTVSQTNIYIKGL